MKDAPDFAGVQSGSRGTVPLYPGTGLFWTNGVQYNNVFEIDQEKLSWVRSEVPEIAMEKSMNGKPARRRTSGMGMFGGRKAGCQLP